MELLMEVSAEKNKIIQQWKKMGLHAKSAFDSQALIQLRNIYCKNYRCLECAIGHQVLSKSRWNLIDKAWWIIGLINFEKQYIFAKSIDSNTLSREPYSASALSWVKDWVLLPPTSGYSLSMPPSSAFHPPSLSIWSLHSGSTWRNTLTGRKILFGNKLILFRKLLRMT